MLILIHSAMFNNSACAVSISSAWSQGGTCENFYRDARVIFLGLKFTKMSFFWVSLSWRHFLGVEKIAAIFLGSLKICVISLGY